MELIDRAAALAAIKSYCAGCDNHDGVLCRSCGYMDAMDKVDEALTVDAVEVVRCRDCVCSGKRPPLPRGYREDAGWCMLHGHVVLPNDFCSYGEAVEEKQSCEAAKQDAYESMRQLNSKERVELEKAVVEKKVAITKDVSSHGEKHFSDAGKVVVRCKDCELFETGGIFYWCNLFQTVMQPDDYCSRGVVVAKKETTTGEDINVPTNGGKA